MVLRFAVALLSAPVLLFVILMAWAGISGQYNNIPDDIGATRDLRKISAVLHGEPTAMQIQGVRPLRADDPFRVTKDPSVIALAKLEKPEPYLIEAAGRWVREVNRTNHGAILYHEVDAHANLYLFAGAWMYQFDMKTIDASTEKFGEMWQQYLLDAMGDWRKAGGDTDDSYAPGLIFVDCEGEVSRLMDGVVRVLRTPVTCD